jgi:ribosomal protein L20
MQISFNSQVISLPETTTWENAHTTAEQIAMTHFGVVVPELHEPELPTLPTPRQYRRMASFGGSYFSEEAGQEIDAIIRANPQYQKKYRANHFEEVEHGNYQWKGVEFVNVEFYEDHADRIRADAFAENTLRAHDAIKSARNDWDDKISLIVELERAITDALAARQCNEERKETLRRVWVKALTLANQNEEIAKAFFIDQYSQADLDIALAAAQPQEQ